MKQSCGVVLCLALVAGLISGCRTAAPVAVIPDMCAMFTPTPVHIDGKLDDPIWKEAQVYPLSLSADLLKKGTTLIEPGTVRFAWDSNYFYMAVAFTDSDVVAEGTENGQHHYQMGDLAELFLWPEEQRWYVEMYVTPRGNFTTFFFPSSGRMLPSCFSTNAFPIKVAAQVDGTLNDYTDHDRGWTGEMAVPVKELLARGAKWGPDSTWRVVVGRYNYSVWLAQTELSECPSLPMTSFHLRESYGRLHLLPPGVLTLTK